MTENLANTFFLARASDSQKKFSCVTWIIRYFNHTVKCTNSAGGVSSFDFWDIFFCGLQLSAEHFAFVAKGRFSC